MNSENDELCKKSGKQVVKRTVMTIAIVTASVLVLLFVANYIFWSILMPMPVGFRRMPVTERDFQRNKELIVLVKDYLAETKNGHIEIKHLYVDRTRTIGMFTHKNGDVTIDDAEFGDAEFADAVTELFDIGYGRITKTLNVIYFQRWSTMDAGVGVVFSINGHVPDERVFTFLTKIEPLEDDGWYYYEDDYNEWKSLNKTR